MKHPRPTSPHLTVYKREWTMIYSILHRFTGVGLVFGLVGLVVWLGALAWGGQVFLTVHEAIAHPAGRIILFLVSWSLAYHLSNGIRHLAWDFGLGFDLARARNSGNLVMVSSLVITLVVWAIGYGLIG